MKYSSHFYDLNLDYFVPTPSLKRVKPFNCFARKKTILISSIICIGTIAFWLLYYCLGKLWQNPLRKITNIAESCNSHFNFLLLWSWRYVLVTKTWLERLYFPSWNLSSFNGVQRFYRSGSWLLILYVYWAQYASVCIKILNKQIKCLFIPKTNFLKRSFSYRLRCNSLELSTLQTKANKEISKSFWEIVKPPVYFSYLVRHTAFVKNRRSLDVISSIFFYWRRRVALYSLCTYQCKFRGGKGVFGRFIIQ